MTPIISTTILRTQSDERLVVLAKDGHERAFEALVERYRRPLLRHVRRILPEARAEDAIQQAFLNAWSALERGVEVREPRAWLYRVAQNAALNALRVQGYEYDELRESVRSSAAGPAEDHERRWVMRRTLAGLAALPEAQREALLRTAVEGRSQEQVAAELGLSEGAVRGLVYRARTALRAAATALTPAPLVGWAAAFASSDAPLNAAERIAQVTAGGGTASVGAVLAKAGAVVAVTGALATGAVAVRDSTDGGGNARADTVKPGADRHGVTAAVPGVSLAAGPAHGVGGQAEHHGRGRGEGRGRDEGRGRGEAEGRGGRGGRDTSGSSGGSGETRSGSNRSAGSGSGSTPGGSGSSGSSGSGSGRSGDDDGHSGSGSGTSDSSGPGASGSGSSGSGGGPGPSDAELSSGGGPGPGGGGEAQIDGGGGGSSSSGPGPGTPTFPSTTTSGSSSSGPSPGGSDGGGDHDLTTTDGGGSSGKGG